MKKRMLIAATGLVAGLALAVMPMAASGATECIPQEAYVETVDHPAVGEPTIDIPNPEYAPATEDTTTTVYVKWDWTDPQKEKNPPTIAPPANGWHEVGETNDVKGNTPDAILHQGNGNGSYFYFQSVTRTIPGTPAQGEPTITVENPDYIAPWVETIQHEAVVCETPGDDGEDPDEPEVPETPVVTPEAPQTTDDPVTTPQPPQEISTARPGTPQLAVTGASESPWIAATRLAGYFFAGVGLGYLVLRLGVWFLERKHD